MKPEVPLKQIFNDCTDQPQKKRMESVRDDGTINSNRKGDVKRIYLSCYNMIMYFGYLYALTLLLWQYMKEGREFFPKTFDNVVVSMCVLQGLQTLEILHPILGIMNGSAFMPFIQIGGRSVMLFLLVGNDPKIRKESVVFFLFFAWSTIETIRYPYYFSQLYKKDIPILTWLRYNAWIILYPLGFYCEAMIGYRNLIFLDQTHKWSLEMPNSLNIIFNSAFVLRIYILFITTPGMLTLFLHMWRVRRLKYGGIKLKKK